jgi:hypothetical protein
LLVVILFAAGFPLIGAYLEGELHLRGLAQWFMLSSPGYAFAGAWDKTISTSWMGYWASMLTLHLLTWCFLVLACWFTPRTWQDRPARKKWRPASLLGFRMAGLEQGAVDFRRRMLDLNAFFWLTARPRFKPGIVWAILIGLTGIWLGGGVKYPNEMFDPSMYVVMALLWNTVLKVWMTSEATRQVAQDRKSGSIELLLSTAITVRDIASGQWLSLRRQLGWPLLAVVAAELLLVFLGMKEVGGREDRVAWCAVWLCCLTMLIADLLTIPTVGLWQSAVARGPAEAAGATAFRILALPWILYMLLGAMVAVADGLGILRNLPNLEWVFWLGGWVFLGFLVNLFFGLRSWRAIHSRFREVASQRGGRGWGHALGRLFETFRAQGKINR